MKFKQTDSGVLVPCGPKDYQFDGLVNVASGLGTAKSKRSYNQWNYDYTDWASLDAMYQSNWIARAIVDEWAADAVREWRSIKCKDAEAIEQLEKELCVKQHVQEAIGWARLYGGSGVVMITNQDLEKPMQLDKIKKGNLDKLLVFDRHDLTPSGDINTFDLLSDNYMRPEFYTISGGSQRIHHSHIAFFNGAKLPKRQARMNFGWGDSELRRCIDEINDMVSSKGGIAELMQEANIDVITREGLTDELSTDQDDSVIKRYELFSLMKSTINMALLDGGEKLDRQTLNLGGVAPILDTFMIWIAGAARMPMTKIFGTSASGMNATGEGDKKNYYDSVRSQQNGDLSLSMRQVDEVLVRSATGSFPIDYDYVWNPLEQLDGVQVAQAQLLTMQKHSLAVQSNFATRAQVMRNLQSNEEYQYEDGVIDELVELEEGNLFDEVVNEPVEPVEVINKSGENMDNKSVNNGYASVKLDDVSAKFIAAHLESAGIKGAIKPEDMHLTLMYSRESNINTPALTSKKYSAKIIGEPSIIGDDPWRALVVKIDSDELRARHEELKQAGGVHSYSDFLPHLSIKYSPDESDLDKLKESMIDGVLRFDRESFEPIK
jgi:phage-related protein (TIGR01555 family)